MRVREEKMEAVEGEYKDTLRRREEEMIKKDEDLRRKDEVMANIQSTGVTPF